MMNFAKSIGALSSIPQDMPLPKDMPTEMPTEGVQQAGDLLMNLEQFMDIVGPINVEEGIRNLIASDSEVKQIQGLMLMKEFQDAVGEGL